MLKSNYPRGVDWRPTFMRNVVTALALAFLIYLAYTDFAESAESQYSKIDFDKSCVWKSPQSEINEQMGGEAICTGFRGIPVYFAEDDLRQFVSFGPVMDDAAFPGGFAQFNTVNTTIEWRLDEGKPFATILRWFIENLDPVSGNPTPAYKGEVLVISTVSDPFDGLVKRVSCAAGYVDALANKNANELARMVADEIARGFVCGRDRPVFHGTRGKLSGDPYDLAQ